MSQPAIQVFLGEPFQREQAFKEKIQALEATQSLGKHTFEGAKVTLGKLQEALFAPSLFEPGRWVLVRHAEEFSDHKALQALLEKGLPGGAYLLLDVEKFDKRSGFYKWLKANAQIHEFSDLDRRTLPGKIKALLQEKGVELTTEAFQYLVTSMPPDLLHIENEVRKLSLFPRTGALDLEDVQGVLFSGQQANVFHFCDTLGARNPQALAQLKQLLESGEEPGKLFYLLANHMRSLLMVKALQAEKLPPPEIAKRSGMAPWMVNRRLQQVRHWSQAELVRVIHQLHREDGRIKQGRSDPEASLLTLALCWVKVGVRQAQRA